MNLGELSALAILALILPMIAVSVQIWSCERVDGFGTEGRLLTALAWVQLVLSRKVRIFDVPGRNWIVRYHCHTQLETVSRYYPNALNTERCADRLSSTCQLCRVTHVTSSLISKLVEHISSCCFPKKKGPVFICISLRKIQ